MARSPTRYENGLPSVAAIWLSWRLESGSSPYEEGSAVIAVALDEIDRVLAALEETEGQVGLAVHVADGPRLRYRRGQRLEEHAEALFGVLGYRQGPP